MKKLKIKNKIMKTIYFNNFNWSIINQFKNKKIRNLKK